MKKKFFIIASCLLLSSCGTTLQSVEQELERGGFVLWYPAEKGIEPGEIWLMDGTRKLKYMRRPKILQIDTPRPASFQTLKTQINAKVKLDNSLGVNTLSNPDFSALLSAGTVKNTEIDFGETTISRIVASDLDDERLPSEYKQALEKIRNKADKMVLISAVVETSGMTYIFTCEDTSQLQAQAPAIERIINTKFDLIVENNKKATWNIPNDIKLVIGFAPEHGGFLSYAGEDAEIVSRNTIAKIKQWKTENMEVTSLLKKHMVTFRNTNIDEQKNYFPNSAQSSLSRPYLVPKLISNPPYFTIDDQSVMRFTMKDKFLYVRFMLKNTSNIHAVNIRAKYDSPTQKNVNIDMGENVIFPNSFSQRFWTPWVNIQSEINKQNEDPFDIDLTIEYDSSDNQRYFSLLKLTVKKDMNNKYKLIDERITFGVK